MPVIGLLELFVALKNAKAVSPGFTVITGCSGLKVQGNEGDVFPSNSIRIFLFMPFIGFILDGLNLDDRFVPVEE